MFKRILILLLPFLSTLATGNGLLITNLSVNDTHTQATFDISWENSWRQTARFHDAVWIYIKYRPDNSIQWEHAGISGGTASGNLELVPQADEMGIFIRNAADFTGNVSATSITLDMLVDSTIAIYPDFEVCGIEMVYVPEGPFFVGDGNDTSLGSDSLYFEGSLYWPENKNRYITRISDAGPVKLDYPREIDIPDTYPNGYDAFYCMKYPFTQKQFVDFLNLLSDEDQREIVQADFSTYNPVPEYPFGSRFRQGIYRRTDTTNIIGGNIYACNLNNDGIFNGPNDGQDVAASFRIDPQMSKNGAKDVYAIEALLRMLNWAGLRPMTSLEYEKAARGPLRPIKGEFAWGSPQYSNINLTNLVNKGTPSEAYNEIDDSKNWLQFSIAYRVGMFAESGTDRIDAQASYWGIQDLSGNGYPLLISAADSDFKNTNGYGMLTGYPLEWTGHTLFFSSRVAVSQIMQILTSSYDQYTSGQLLTVDFTSVPGNDNNLGILKGRGVRQP